jgi:hypothetical protein
MGKYEASAKSIKDAFTGGDKKSVWERIKDALASPKDSKDLKASLDEKEESDKESF